MVSYNRLNSFLIRIDLIFLLLDYLSARDVLNLSYTSHTLHDVINPTGWRAFEQKRGFRNVTVDTDFLSSGKLNLFNQVVDRHWEERKFVAQSLWQRLRFKCMARIKVDGNKVVCGLGSELHYAEVLKSESSTSKLRRYRESNCFNIGDWRSYNLGQTGPNDVTDICLIPSDSSAILIAQANGLLRRIRLSSENIQTEVIYSSAHKVINSIDVSLSSDALFAASSRKHKRHEISMYQYRHPTNVMSCQMENKPWVLQILPNAGKLAIGTASDKPLEIRDFTSSGLYDEGHHLGSSQDAKRVAVYAIQSISSHPELLLAGYYDGHTQLFDVREPSRVAQMTLFDPYDYSPTYSLAQASEYRIIAGGAVNGILRMWDLRYFRKNESSGWSAYLGKDRSPVYSLAAEHSRVFAATQSTLWGLDFSANQKQAHPKDDISLSSRATSWRSGGSTYPNRRSNGFGLEDNRNRIPFNRSGWTADHDYRQKVLVYGHATGLQIA